MPLLLASPEGIMEKNSNQYRVVANLIFNEYNEVSALYDLPHFDSQDELEVILRDNIDDHMIDELAKDELGRMALAGFLSSLMVEIETSISALNLDGGSDEDQTH